MTLTHEHLFDNEGTVSQRRVEASFDGETQATAVLDNLDTTSSSSTGCRILCYNKMGFIRINYGNAKVFNILFSSYLKQNYFGLTISGK